MQWYSQGRSFRALRSCANGVIQRQKKQKEECDTEEIHAVVSGPERNYKRQEGETMKSKEHEASDERMAVSGKKKDLAAVRSI